jgi:hypothetical protein
VNTQPALSIDRLLFGRLLDAAPLKQFVFVDLLRHCPHPHPPSQDARTLRSCVMSCLYMLFQLQLYKGALL